MTSALCAQLGHDRFGQRLGSLDHETIAVRFEVPAGSFNGANQLCRLHQMRSRHGPLPCSAPDSGFSSRSSRSLSLDSVN